MRSRSASPMKPERTPLHLKDSNLLPSSNSSSKSNSPTKGLRYSRYTQLNESASRSRSTSPSKRSSPLRQQSSSPIKKARSHIVYQDDKPFEIYQDSTDYRSQLPALDHSVEDKENVPPSLATIEYNTENLSRIPQRQRETRKVLHDLPITEYAGFAQEETGVLAPKFQLTNSWMVDFNANRPTYIPSYVTPPKNRLKYIYVGSMDSPPPHALRRTYTDTARRRLDFAMYNDNDAMH